jgi:hypothetical protein
MSHEHHEALDMEKEASWMEQREQINEILRNGVEAYVRDIPNLENAFEGREHTLCCMDEGTARGDMRSAGSGILTEGEDRKAFLQSLLDAGVEQVTSHEGCGAAALFRKKHGLESMSVDDVAKAEAQKIVAELNAMRKEGEPEVSYAGHITDLSRPKEFHNARTVYYDATGKFNPSKVAELPPGFVVSRRFMNPEQAINEVKIALAIAFGDHGFGNKFSSQEPLLLVPIADQTEPGFDQQRLTEELERIAASLVETSPKDAERVKIDGFTMPQTALAEAA